MRVTSLMAGPCRQDWGAEAPPSIDAGTAPSQTVPGGRRKGKPSRAAPGGLDEANRSPQTFPSPMVTVTSVSPPTSAPAAAQPRMPGSRVRPSPANGVSAEQVVIAGGGVVAEEGGQGGGVEAHDPARGEIGAPAHPLAGGAPGPGRAAGGLV